MSHKFARLHGILKRLTKKIHVFIVFFQNMFLKLVYKKNLSNLEPVGSWKNVLVPEFN